jgi:DNA-dependent RNA polymerase auxiliary subunit epsilon
MIFKVYYQVNTAEVPIRENTQALFVEGESVRDVRQKLKKEPFNVESVEEINGAYLEYEKQQDDFKVLELR